MRSSTLKLKSYEIPDDLDGAKHLCRELVDEVEKTRAYYQQQIEFIKQQYKAALRRLRPDIVTPVTLREMFDEAEMTVSAVDEIEVQDECYLPDYPDRNTPVIPTFS